MRDLQRNLHNTFSYLFDKKYEFLYLAQEAEDLGNTEGAEILRMVAGQLEPITKKLAERLDEEGR